MRKLWLDVETTGLDTNKHGIIQLACIDDETGDTFSIDMKPANGCIYDEGAEKIHGKSEKDISKYEPEKSALKKFIRFLEKNNKGSQYQIAGYNSRFDMEFIIYLFKRNGENFWTHFNYYDVDVFALVKILDLTGVIDKKPSKKLTAICELMGVNLKNAHNAMADIKATKKLYKKIIKRYIK